MIFFVDGIRINQSALTFRHIPLVFNIFPQTLTAVYRQKFRELRKTTTAGFLLDSMLLLTFEQENQQNFARYFEFTLKL